MRSVIAKCNLGIASPAGQGRSSLDMAHHDDQHRQHGSENRDEDDEHGLPGHAGDQRAIGGQGSSAQDRGEYGGLGSGEGQGEFAGDGYSAQGQFSNQRVAQYGDQGNAQDYGRQGIGWQNRQQAGESDGQESSGQSERPGETQRDERRSGTSSS